MSSITINKNTINKLISTKKPINLYNILYKTYTSKNLQNTKEKIPTNTNTTNNTTNYNYKDYKFYSNVVNPSIKPIDVNNYNSTPFVKELIETIPDNDNSFFIANQHKAMKQKKLWDSLFPTIKPFYAVKSNPDEHLLNTLVHCGTGFDVASEQEIVTLINKGVKPKDLIYAHTIKQISTIKIAKKLNVKQMTVDNIEELYKLEKHYKECELILRIKISDAKARIVLGDKFGSEKEEAIMLINKAKELGMKITGIAFHVGSNSLDASSFYKAIEKSKEIYDICVNKGFDIKMLDIGGGYPGYDDGCAKIEDISIEVNKGLNKFYKEELSNANNTGFQVVSEPGTFFSASYLDLATYIVGKKYDENSQTSHVYISDGVYTSFINSLLPGFELSYGIPDLVKREDSDYSNKYSRSKYSKNLPIKNTVIWGRTCDSFDKVGVHNKDNLPYMNDIEVGDLLVFKNIGSYSTVTASYFNGFPHNETYYPELI